MNTKLLIASLIGVGSIGGAVAGSYYLSKESNKKPNTSEDYQTTNEVTKTDTQTPLTKPQPPASEVRKEPVPTSPKLPGTSGNEVVASGVEGGGVRADSSGAVSPA